MTQLVQPQLDAVADAAGTATVRFAGPGDNFDVLAVDAISCTSDSALLPGVTIYRGEPVVGRRLAFNPDGRSGTFRGGATSDVIPAGDLWSVQWTGATPGAACSAALTGTVRRRGT
jgi:hypothetical protein